MGLASGGDWWLVHDGYKNGLSTLSRPTLIVSFVTALAGLALFASIAARAV